MKWHNEREGTSHEHIMGVCTRVGKPQHCLKNIEGEGAEGEGVELILFMPHWQTLLINVIKRLFSLQQLNLKNNLNKFGYIKYKFEEGGLIFFYKLKGGGR